jgi:hypothetical protein
MQTKAKRPGARKICQLPTAMTVSGRSSSITNAFIAAVIPVFEPSIEEELEALRILELDPEDIRCAYCGDKSTEWDHLRAIVANQEPTGFVTEIANLVPACGKCNQSKGKQYWRTWMESDARLSPKTRKIPDLANRISRLERYEAWREPRKIDFESTVGAEMWQLHRKNWRGVLDSLKSSQKLATEILAIVKAKTGVPQGGPTHR